MVRSPGGRGEAHRGSIWQGGEELGHGEGLAGQDELRTDRGQRLEHEAALGEARVGHGEVGEVEAGVARVEQIEIKRARGIGGAPGRAAELLFAGGEAGEKGRGVEGGFDFEHRIEEGGRTGRAADGVGFVDGGEGGRARSLVEREQEIAAGAEVGQAVAEIGAEGEAGLHRWHHSTAAAEGQAASADLPRGAARVREWVMRASLLCLSACLAAAGPLGAQDDEDVSPYKEMKTLARAVELIRQDYVDEDKTDYEELIYNALRGMLAELDPHSDFMDPKDFKGMQEDTRSEFGGLGVVVTRKDDRLSVVAPMEGTPGFRAGLLPGDILLEIDGQSAEKMSLRDAVDKLRGAAGTTVKLAVARVGESEPLRFEVEREVIKVPSVRGAKILATESQRIGYVRVAQFSEPTGKEFARALNDLEKQGMDALVLDLRFNPGGLLGSAVEVAGEFLPGGALVAYTEGRSASAARRYTAPSKGGKQRAYPVAVLVNGSSASGAEIVAGALKDSGRALLVGEKTFGKGSVQSVVSLPDGSAVRLTTAEYFTPGKQPIHEQGVAPHVSAPMSAADEARLLALRRQEDLPAGTQIEELEPVEDVPLRRAVDALRGVLLQAKEGAAEPSKEG